MTATAHALVGTVIAAKFGNPSLAIPIALSSHIIMDFIPHWDPVTHRRDGKSKDKLFRDSMIDVVLSFVSSYFLAVYLFPQTNLSYVFTIVVFSQLFDWLTSPYYFFGINLPPFNWSYKFQKLFDNKLDKPWGIVTQSAVIIAVLILARLIN